MSFLAIRYTFHTRTRWKDLGFNEESDILLQCKCSLQNLSRLKSVLTMALLKYHSMRSTLIVT